jgi:hypothetical protein
MRCKTCDYPLWNIKARQCPECGTVYAPSEFEFVINSVQFCCPHCEQVYYGTGIKGHLVPAEFNCVTCGQRVHMNQMLLRPAEGVTEDQTQTDRMPWVERKQHGFIKAWFKTVGKSMVNPASLMRGVPIDDPLGRAWGYAVVSLFIILTIGAGLPIVAFSAIAALTGGPRGAGILIAAPSVVIGGMIIAIAGLAMWGAIAHGMLRITGGAEHSIGRTYQALLYSTGAMAPLGVPCIGPYCGTYVMWIWWGISGTLMVAQGQRVHAGRAALAVFAFPCVAVGLFILGYMGLIFGVMMAGGTRGFAQSAVGETSVMTSGILQHAQVNGGAGPTHALELVTSANLSTPNFHSMTTATDPTLINIGGTTLDKIDYMPPNRQAAMIQSVANVMPVNVVAHRCGDFVFTYHGIDLNNCDPNLWIVIFSPDPDTNPPGTVIVSPGAGANPPGAVQQRVHVGLASGATRGLASAFAAELAQQNQLRASYNLSPLPDPATVTHDAPAVDESQ